jgi:hypothetical protein
VGNPTEFTGDLADPGGEGHLAVVTHGLFYREVLGEHVVGDGWGTARLEAVQTNDDGFLLEQGRRDHLLRHEDGMLLGTNRFRMIHGCVIHCASTPSASAAPRVTRRES